MDQIIRNVMSQIIGTLILIFNTKFIEQLNCLLKE